MPLLRNTAPGASAHTGHTGSLYKCRLGSLAALAILTVAFPFSCCAARAQGCAQCKDNAATLPPQTRAAYRHAILLLAGAGTGIFLVTIVAVRRSR